MMKKYDLVVCGGGIAGCAAAVAASRRGLKCALIEKGVILGGLATAGLVLVYLPLCDGRGKQVIYGLGEELLHIANKYGPVDEPADWKNGKERFQVHFSPASYVLSLEELLVSSGVDIWYDTLVIGVNTENQTVKSVRVANKSGILEIAAERFVDATGDADLIWQAGEKCNEATNAMVTWVVEHREARKSSEYELGEKVSTLIMSEPVSHQDTPPGINGKTVSDFMIEGRRRYREELKADYEKGRETRKTRFPLLLPTMVPMRHSRSMQGKFLLDDGMTEIDFEDSIGILPDWRKAGPRMAVPYRTLVPEKLQGILAAGRCISAVHDAWEITRVIPSAAMTGEVAGVAAALSLEQQVQPDELDYKLLAGNLKNLGFPLKLADLD